MTRKKSKHKVKKKEENNVGTIAFIAVVVGLFIFGAVIAFSGDNDVADISELEGFAACLLESDAIFYGTEWCGFCNQQKQVLGEVYNQFSGQFYVDCDRERGKCSAARIRSYPTWIINGRPYVGVQSIDALSAAMNCQL